MKIPYKQFIEEHKKEIEQFSKIQEKKHKWALHYLKIFLAELKIKKKAEEQFNRFIKGVNFNKGD